MQQHNKKGQVSNLASNIILLGGAAIVLVMLLVILQSTRDIDVIKEAYDARINNESSYINVTGDTLAGVSYPGASNFAIVEARNRTSGLVIQSGNYTVNAITGVISNASSIQWSTVNVTYTFTHGGEAYSNANETLDGLGNFSDFWSIIVLAIVASVVLGIIFALFGGKGQR